MPVKITYYGVRGSTPSPGKDFNRYGGNTTCVFIQTEDQNIILDAGTGIRMLGNDLMNQGFGTHGGHCHLLFSHTHWDHIQGFPFFVPAYLPQNRFDIYGETKIIPVPDGDAKHQWSIQDVLSMQQNFMYFPVSTKDLASSITYHVVESGHKLDFGYTEVNILKLKHPNSSLGFSFKFKKNKYVFCTDVEHSPEMIEELAEFAKDADYLAYDSQYTPEEYKKSKIGWGHSTFAVAAEIARKAKVKMVHMIHHDPIHNDAALDDLEKRAQAEYKNIMVVPEGYTIDLE